ncbi:transcription factor HES-5-like [Carcharodon carcharias]|uniref:transcription factor HES-5-like n=1 Tax=Carcharodon carcharias TaxID=13397 RepID=UPI001B7DE801|nr:transcription factor HES-5-like [Carcharodon carcharias]
MNKFQKDKLIRQMVEKRRRDRINRSLLQLKGLLQREFHRDQGNCKLEKAEILETSVSFLKHWRLFMTAPPARQPLQDYNDGYSQCLQETLCFLAQHHTKMAALPGLLQSLHGASAGGEGPHDPTATFPQPPACQTPAKLALTPGTRTLWRPWQV